MFLYFPKSYMWSLGMNLAISTSPWGGGEIGELDQIGSRLKDAVETNDLNAWFQEWSTMAERLDDLGKRAQQDGHSYTARELYFRASNYHLLAERFLVPSDPRKKASYERCLASFKRASELYDPPIERIEIPYLKSSLPAYFVRGAGLAGHSPAPTIVFFDGLDVPKEGLFFFGAREFAQRGFSVLIVDGPGQGEALRRGIPTRPDFEVAGSAVADYLATRADVDPARLAVVAPSLGGYIAPRVAAFEPRFKACVAWGAIYDYRAVWEERVRSNNPNVSVPRAQIQWVWGKDTFDEAFEEIRKFNLRDVLPRLTCPFLVIHGAEDRQVPVEQARRSYEEAASKVKNLRIFTAEEGGSAHCQVDNLRQAHAFIADWLHDVFNKRLASA